MDIKIEANDTCREVYLEKKLMLFFLFYFIFIFLHFLGNGITCDVLFVTLLENRNFYLFILI